MFFSAGFSEFPVGFWPLVLSFLCRHRQRCSNLSLVRPVGHNSGCLAETDLLGSYYQSMHNIYYRMYSFVNILYMVRRVLKSLFGTSWITKNIMDSLHTHLKATRSCLFMTTVFCLRITLNSVYFCLVLRVFRCSYIKFL